MMWKTVKLPYHCMLHLELHSANNILLKFGALTVKLEYKLGRI